MDARFDRGAVLRMTPDFSKREQLHFLWRRSMTADSGGEFFSTSNLLRRFDRAARDSRAGVTRWIGLQIVFFVVNDQRFADDRIRTGQAQLAFPIEVRFAGSIGLNVAEIALVTFSARSSAMFVLHRIEMRAGRCCVRRRTIAF